MRSIVKFLLLLFLVFNSLLLFSQVTITEINSTEEKIVSKPMPYDSLQNWGHQERLKDYQKYIGLQIYLPPIGIPPKEENQIVIKDNFLFSIQPSIIKIKKGIYDSIITYVYKPLPYKYLDSYNRFWICSDSNKVSNTYYTILNMYYGENIDSILNYMENTLNKYISVENLFIDDLAQFQSYEPSHIFLVRNDITSDSLYCFYTDNFIFVPYFIKQKQLYKNQVLVYDDSNYPMEESDIRFVIKYETGDKFKKVKVERGSKWICSDVTLLKPSYEMYYMYYILRNDKDEQIVLPQIDQLDHGFILEKDYIKRENEKKVEAKQLIALRNKEELIRIENERKIYENRKIECINKFGQQYGELIAQGKLKVGMTIEMCKVGWGMPLWTKKVTTEYGVFEDWYYGYGYSLHFVNGTLKIIEE